MLGTIIGIEEDTVLVKLNVSLNQVPNIVNLHVVMEDGSGILVGEITNVKEGIAYVNLLGEIIDNKFTFGITKKPSFNATVKLISKEKIPMIISVDNYEEKKDLYIGKSSVYDGVPIALNINNFFANHFAIFGSTGSGKSWGVARILQSIFDKKTTIAYRSSIFIFDAYGEYHSAFKNIDQFAPELSFKAYTTNTKISEWDMLKIPLWLLTLDDFALLLNAEKSTQIPIIEKALKLVNVFARDEKEVIKQKNDISNICESEHCHCQESILKSSIIHTLKISTFILIINIILGCLINEEILASSLTNNQIISPIIASLIGLIPNCASSIIITELYIENLLDLGSCIAGLLSGSGLGILILFKQNKNLFENVFITSILILIASLCGIIINLI